MTRYIILLLVSCIAFQQHFVSARAGTIPCRTCGTFLAGAFTPLNVSGSQPGLQPLSHPLTLTINSPQNSVSLHLGEIQPGGLRELEFTRANTDPAEWDAYHAEVQKQNLGLTGAFLSTFLGPFGTTTFVPSPSYPYHEYDLQ